MALENEVNNAKKALQNKMEEYGSVELMANIAIKETRDQSITFHDPSNPNGENPFLAYSLGLFLSHNNLNAREPHPNQIQEFIMLLTDYFDKFKCSLINLDNPNPPHEDAIAFRSKLQKIVDDGNPHIYPNQKNEYYENVFTPLNQHFISKYGFSIEYAKKFADDLMNSVEKHMQSRLNLTREKIKEAKAQLKKPESAPFLEIYKEKNVTPEQLIYHYAETLFLNNSKDALTINLDKYCKEHNIKNKEMCKKYLTTFSCTFGEQFKEFNDLLSDNIIFYKPIIKLDESNFFLPKPDFLHDKLDSLLEYLLEDEKKDKTEIWHKFANLKSKYVENKVYEFISRIFPPKCIHQNAYYWIGRERKEADLLVIYDNKIFIIESKSGNLPLSVKREGKEMLKTRLEDLVKKASTQCINTKNYIKSQPNVTFWADELQNKVLVKIDSSSTDYEFFFIDATLEHLGSISTNLKNIDAFDFFQEGDYPLTVYLHDFDVITELLSEPIYFIHYIQQRMIVQNQNVFESPLELSLLAYYLTNGTLVQNVEMNSKILHIPDHIDPIDKYYQSKQNKPQLLIPKKLEELLLNMQKYHQKGFTNITSLLLDFPQDRKKLIVDLIERKFNKTIQSGIPDEFMAVLGKPYNIGFSYYTANNMANFYKYCKTRSEQRKLEHNITRWASIGRNVSDKKNHATFFIFDNHPNK